MGVYRPMRVKAGREAQLHASISSFDELTGLFLSAVASPQSRPPLHPVRSPYKPHDPAQVFFESDTTFLLLPDLASTKSRWMAVYCAAVLSLNTTMRSIEIKQLQS